MKFFHKFKNPLDLLINLKEYIDKYENRGIHSSISASVKIVNPDLVFIGENVTIEENAKIIGPCILEEGAHVGHCGLIRPYTILDKGAVVGHATEVKHSILLPHSKAPHFNYVGDSILGSYVNLGAGAICANMRFDQHQVKIKLGNDFIDTGIKKFGSIIGTHANIGCNVVLQPGTLVLPHTCLYTRPELVRFTL
ncbi:MAG: UDP-N-acetylglucosamine diphosphorylase [Simkaniaceae bacterium]|nr:UDP-N-acetylglucosamine diphosphorylase [Simkaniaceae bacterium]